MSDKAPARILPKALSQLMGIKDDKAPTEKSSVVEYSSKYSRSEQNTFFRNTHVTNPRANQQILNPKGMMQYFAPVHDEIGRILHDIEKMKLLAPEINQASIIRVSTIMSPNDLQEGVFKCAIDELEELDESIRAEISEYITDFINEVLNLGGKADDWCKQCLYGAGSVPIFTFPSTHFQAFKKDGLQTDTSTMRVVSTENGGKIGNEALTTPEAYYTEQTRKMIWDKKIVSNPTAATESFTILMDKASEKQDLYKAVMEDLHVLNPDIFSFNDEDKIPDEILTSLESMKVTLTKKLDEGDVIKLSENPEIIKFAGEYKNFKKKNLDRKYEESLNSYMYYRIDELVSMQKYEENDEKELGHPFYMVLPPESVIPIHVPGNPKEHLGYLVLIDEFGHPLAATDSASKGCCGGSVGAAHQAMFGSACGGNKLDRYSKAMSNSVFDHLLDNYIKAKLTGMGLDSVDVEKANGIANVMFFRLLEHKRTGMVFVPPTLMTYLCFDYRSNGTGKSLLEDIHFILSLRATFMVASVMAMANDSVNHHNISLTFDEKTTNYEQIMDMVANQYVDKRKMKLSIDPTDISRNIARNALTISPKNMAGIQGFDIENTNQAGTSVKVDNDLMSTFDTMLVTALGVPYAALNQLSETEYSRSVVTGNLFFSKQIKKDQNVLCKHMEQFVKTYIKYSRTLKEGILNIIKSKGKLNDKVNTNTAANTNDGVIDTKDMPVIMAKIIDHIQLRLPTPNIAPDKAQYSELKEYLATIDELANVLFANELVGQEDMKAQGMLGIIRAFWKKYTCEDIFNRLGGFNTLELPSVEDLSGDQIKWVEFSQALNNFAKLLEESRTQLTTATTDGFGGSSDSFGGGMGMDDGMGGDMGGGDDFGGGMDDMGGMEEPTDMDDTGMEEEPAPSETDQPGTNEPPTESGAIS